MLTPQQTLWLEEDKRYLVVRVARLDTGMDWAEDPPSRTRHLIGNLEAAPLANGEVEALWPSRALSLQIESSFPREAGSQGRRAAGPGLTFMRRPLMTEVISELYRTRGGVAGDPIMIVCAVSWPLVSAASTVPISGPA